MPNLLAIPTNEETFLLDAADTDSPIFSFFLVPMFYFYLDFSFIDRLNNPCSTSIVQLKIKLSDVVNVTNAHKMVI